MGLSRAVLAIVGFPGPVEGLGTQWKLHKCLLYEYHDCWRVTLRDILWLLVNWYKEIVAHLQRDLDIFRRELPEKYTFY